MSLDQPIRVLIPFNTISLYGMERGVIETFDLLRPEVEPHFLLSLTAKTENLPVHMEIRRRNLSHSFFSDEQGWPRIGKAKSVREFGKMLVAMVRGNYDVFKASAGKDVLYIPSINYFYFAFFGALRLRLSRKRVVFQFHDLLVRPSRQLRLISKFITDFVHNTRLGQQEVCRTNSYVSQKRSLVVPCPVAGRPTSPDESPEMKRNVDKHILFVGQVATHKGIDLLLDAFGILKRKHPQLTLSIVGGCHEPELITRLDLNSKDRNSGINYCGYRDDVLAMMKQSQVYVHPSPPSRFHESFGRGVVEAMSVGTPAVCFRSGALQEIVVHESTGLLCQDESAAELARNIQRFLDDTEFREQCSRSAKIEFERRYSDCRIKKLWLDFLRPSC